MLAEAKPEAEQVLPRQHLPRHARRRTQLCCPNEVFCRALPRPVSRSVELKNVEVQRAPRLFFGPGTGNQVITDRPAPHLPAANGARPALKRATASNDPGRAS